MEQIYYTQCPVGYGLGASNGFQIKRMTPGYPISGDFRHLGLKAFPGGGRVLAPASLRYRRDGGVAEVARLSPRPSEYDTERGLWGRPGGHFAHALRLSDSDLASIRHWPAGLLDGPIWKQTDREPTRGRPPDEVEISAASPAIPATFAAVAPLADGQDRDILARLLTALAIVAREGRTLFLIDDPARLAPRIQLLTFAFPHPYRAELTFSTYHDRPEDLPGYRIQGTIPLARPNRAALTSLGVVADLVSGMFEPSIEAAAWARTLAGWLLRHDPIDEADWSATEERARSAHPPDAPASPWADDWLDPLFAYPEAQRSKLPPGDPGGWAALGAFTDWQRRSGLSADWSRVRNPPWWQATAEAGAPVAEARQALVSHLALKDPWRAESHHPAWGEAVAAWLRDADPVDRDPAITAILRTCPRSARPAFARALLRGLTPEGASTVLDRLHADPSSDRGMLLPLEAGAEVAAILDGGDPARLRSIVEEAKAMPGTISAVLDAVESAIDDRPEAIPTLAAIVASAFETDAHDGGLEALSWALRRPKATAPAWLGPFLRPIFADPDRAEDWQGLRDRTPDDLRPDLARAVLTVTRDDRLPDDAFRWAVERLLLPLAPRPHDPNWAETYLRRMPSDWKLIGRLFSAGSSKIGVLDWIEQARRRGEVSPEQSARLDRSRAFARTLNDRDSLALRNGNLPWVPPEERGVLLEKMLAYVGGSDLEGLPIILGVCREQWPGAFEAGAVGLASFAVPLARRLAGLKLDPGGWFHRVGEILRDLGLGQEPGRGFEPDGLAAEIVAATSALPGSEPWKLRQMLVEDDAAWPVLAADIRRELAGAGVPSAPGILNEWDRRLAQPRPERFAELFLNACDGPRLAAIVVGRDGHEKPWADRLKSMPPLSWWDRARHPGAINDLRDGFARLAPFRPFRAGEPRLARLWMADSAPVSAQGSARWRSLLALSEFQGVRDDPEKSWQTITGWTRSGDPPLRSLSVDDRHRFVAWLLLGLRTAEPHQVGDLAAWLKEVGIADPGRIDRWDLEIEDLAEIPMDAPLLRSRIVADLRVELKRLLGGPKEPRGPRV